MPSTCAQRWRWRWSPARSPPSDGQQGEQQRAEAEVPLDVLRDQVAQFPTYTEAYLTGLEKLPA